MGDMWACSDGYFRDFWVLEHFDGPSFKERMGLKILRWEHDRDHFEFGTTRRDALVMERLTRSPRIMNIYGHCSTSVSVEVFTEFVEDVVIRSGGYAKQEDLDDSKDVDVRNDLSLSEKLEMALSMAEAIADLHGFEGGTIVHDDIKLDQFLMPENGTLKLGDFNRAILMQWDEEKGRYCKFRMGKSFGTVSMKTRTHAVLVFCCLLCETWGQCFKAVSIFSGS